MPKNFQISQYEEPLAEDGFAGDRRAGRRAARFGIQRLHLEEDVGKLVHEGDFADAQSSLVDFNRSGVPLMETVSHPDLALARGGRRVPAGLPRRAALPRRVRRQHGGGLAALRRQRLAPAPRGDDARHQGRDQEPELVPQRAARARVRGAPAGAGPGRRRAHRAGDAAVGARPRRHALDALEGVRARLPLLPRARPGAAAARPPAGWTEIRAALPELPRARRQRFVTQYGLPAYDAGDPHAVAARWPTTTRPRPAREARGHANPKTISNWVMSELLRELAGDDEAAIAALADPRRRTWPGS